MLPFILISCNWSEIRHFSPFLFPLACCTFGRCIEFTATECCVIFAVRTWMKTSYPQTFFPWFEINSICIHVCVRCSPCSVLRFLQDAEQRLTCVQDFSHRWHFSSPFIHTFITIVLIHAYWRLHRQFTSQTDVDRKQKKKWRKAYNRNKKNSNFVLDKTQEAQILLRIFFFHSYKFSPTSFLSSLHNEIGVVCGGARVCVALCVSLGFVVFAPTWKILFFPQFFFFVSLSSNHRNRIVNKIWNEIVVWQ